MRILVTGAAGFIGSHLLDALEPAGHDIVAIDNFLTGRPENFPGVLTGDITARHDLYDTANQLKPELVIHCAASYSDPNLWHRDTDTNVAGAINVAAVAKHHDAKIIYFQTILPPVSSYAISKIAGEHYLRLSGQPLTVFRLANIYGPRNLSGPIPVFYKRLTTGQSCVVVDTTRDMVYVSDLINAVTYTISAGWVGSFDICSGTQTPILDMFRLVSEAVGIKQEPPLIPPNPDDVQGTIDRRYGPPGWKPWWSLPEGVAHTVASYRESGVKDTYTHLTMKG